VVTSNFVDTPDILAEYGTYTMYTVSTGHKVLKKERKKERKKEGKKEIKKERYIQTKANAVKP
jgi:hypothetical protein